MRLYDDNWHEDVLINGLSSGEGLINYLGKNDVNSQHDGSNQILRTLVNEPEFASVLNNTHRQGNNLSAVLRNAWDSEPLNVLTRNNPIKADGFHISVLGHITPTELVKLLNQTELSNGFANRFIWVYVERENVLAMSKPFEEERLKDLAHDLRDTFEFMHKGEMRMNEAAIKRWTQVYEGLTSYPDTIEGTLLQRGAPQVMRLALIYALMDKAEIISVDHLNAALSLWNYAEQSVNYIFGSTEVDPKLSKLYTLITNSGEAGLSRTEMMAAFNNHIKKQELDDLLNRLLTNGLIQSLEKETLGKTATVYKVIENAN